MMNPYLMPIAEQKTREFRKFAQLVVYAFTFGLCVAALLYATKWGW